MYKGAVAKIAKQDILQQRHKWNAKDYHKSSSEQQKWAEELIGKLKLKGNERVLDIGCGDGKVTAEIAKSLSKGFVLGIDSSGEMIRFAKRTFSQKEFSNLAFKKIDVRDLSFDNKFDVVFSNACLHWVINHFAVLKRIKKSLKHCGRVLIQMGGKGNAAKIFEILEEMLKGRRWSKYFLNLGLGISIIFLKYKIEIPKSRRGFGGLRAIPQGVTAERMRVSEHYWSAIGAKPLWIN